jgi:hypothetical protein
VSNCSLIRQFSLALQNGNAYKIRVRIKQSICGCRGSVALNAAIVKVQLALPKGQNPLLAKLLGWESLIIASESFFSKQLNLDSLPAYCEVGTVFLTGEWSDHTIK